jgi:DNA-binding NtrC family response regulator
VKRARPVQGADGGTLFLDEVPELQLPRRASCCACCKRARSSRWARNDDRHVDVRVISATHRNLKSLVARASSAKTSYYRLNALELTIPPLRERGEDLLLLVDHFLKRFQVGEKLPTISAARWRRSPSTRSPATCASSSTRSSTRWCSPRAARSTLAHLPPEIVGEPTPRTARSASPAARGDARVRARVPEARGAAGARQRGEAANLLGISRKNLWEKLRGYGFTEPSSHRKTRASMPQRRFRARARRSTRSGLRAGRSHAEKKRARCGCRVVRRRESVDARC